MSDKLIEYYKTCSNDVLVKEKKRFSRLLISQKKIIDRSSKSLLSLPARSGLRGGKNTSLQAKHQRNLERYIWIEEMISLINSLID